MFNPLSSGDFKGKIKNRSASDVEPQEIFLDKMSRKKEEEIGVSEKKLSVPLAGWVMKIFAVAVFSLLFILLGRSFQMQVLESHAYESLAKRNRLIIEPTEILRGVIYDKDGKQLAENRVTFDVYIDKNKFSGEGNLDEISKILDLNQETVEDRIKEIDGRGVLAENLNHESAVVAEIKARKLEGVSLEKTIERSYPETASLAHLLGYTGKVTRDDLKRNPDRYTIHDYIGKSGLEKYYDQVLARNRSLLKKEVDARGDLQGEGPDQEIQPGDNLQLWLDLDLQRKITEAVEDVLDDIGSSKASVVAIDPDTGGVLASVSIPSYDNNVFSRTGDKELLNDFLTNEEGVFYNRSVEVNYPPGSIIKPILAVGALEEGIISPQKQIHSPGYLEIPNPWDPTNPTRIRDFQAHGWTDMRRALAVSSNVYFYTIGGGHDGQEGLGIKRIKHYLNQFGWGSKTGIDLPNEVDGLIPSPEWKTDVIGTNWTLGDTYNTSIGQGYLTTTPMQIAVSYSALVNGGRVLAPRMVKSIQDKDGVTKSSEAKVLSNDIASTQNLEVVKEGMRLTVEEGTATSLNRLPVDSGAKTGTAQIPKEGHYHNWIGVFAPYDDPEIVLVVLVEEVEGIRASAGRIAYDVLEWYFDESKEDNNQENNN